MSTQPAPTISEKTAAAISIAGMDYSAGLESLKQFLHYIPANSSMAFVLAQHLLPNHASQPTEILQRTTAMPLAEELDQNPLEPNRYRRSHTGTRSSLGQRRWMRPGCCGSLWQISAEPSWLKSNKVSQPPLNHNYCL